MRGMWVHAPGLFAPPLIEAARVFLSSFNYLFLNAFLRLTVIDSGLTKTYTTASFMCIRRAAQRAGDLRSKHV